MKCSEFLRLLKRDGWYVVRQKGSHMQLRHSTKNGRLTFANHGSKELAKGTEMKFRKDAKL